MSRRLSVSQVFGSTNPEVHREPYGHLKIYEGDSKEIDGAATALQHAANENGFGQSEDAPDRFIAKMKGMSGSTMKTLCQGGISDDPPEGQEEGGFYTEAFKTADIILTSHDSNGSLRGFCCVKKNHTFDDIYKPGYLYITLICNATKHGMSSRQGVQHAAGKNILLFLAEYAMKGGWDAIALSAIEEVITYYYKFGYRFIKKCGDKQKDWMQEDINNLKILIIKKFKTEKRGEELDTKDKKAYQKALRRFKRYGDDTGNIYTGPSRTDFLELKQDVQDDAWGTWWKRWKESNTKSELDDPTPTEGYKMIWCANDPKGATGAGDFKAYLAAIEAAGFTKKPMSKKKPGAKKGGRRRTRRRKKKTKKKMKKKTRKKRGGSLRRRKYKTHKKRRIARKKTRRRRK